jgi:putative SOS response-associated peptidase YedK
LACRFTLGEAAVLAVIAVEVRKHGRCTLHLNTIAALAGVCRTTAKNALREAAGLGFIRVTVRRLTAWRCDSNVVVILDGAWTAWLAMGRRGVQSKPCLARIPEGKKGAAYRPQRAIGDESEGSAGARFWRDERTRSRK